jgi:hypothetical protein
MSGLRTEFEFILPKGVVDDGGAVHRQGTMRLATARDELEPLNDPKVKDADDPYLTIIVLARVITGLGTRTRLSPKDVEGLYAADLAYLQDFYSIINFGTDAEIDQLQRHVSDLGRRSSRSEPDARPAPSSPHALTADAAAAAIEARHAALEAERSAAADLEGFDAAAHTTRRPKASPPDDGDGFDGPVIGEDGIELPTPRRNRIEEVGRSGDRPNDAR